MSVEDRLNRPERMNGKPIIRPSTAPVRASVPRAIAYAEDIAANCAPSSVAVIKQQVYADTMRDLFESMGRPDFVEGITSFFEKRPPNFPPLKG